VHEKLQRRRTLIGGLTVDEKAASVRGDAVGPVLVFRSLRFTEKSSTGAPARNVSSEATGTAMILLLEAEVKELLSVSPPGCVTPAGARNLPLSAGTGECPDVDLVPSGLVGFICDPSAVRREPTVREIPSLCIRCERNDPALAVQAKDPDLKPPVERPDDAEREEAAVGRPVLGMSIVRRPGEDLLLIHRPAA
jgi:hypothetical protein